MIKTTKKKKNKTYVYFNRWKSVPINKVHVKVWIYTQAMRVARHMSIISRRLIVKFKTLQEWIWSWTTMSKLQKQKKILGISMCVAFHISSFFLSRASYQILNLTILAYATKNAIIRAVSLHVYLNFLRRKALENGMRWANRICICVCNQCR